MKRILLFVTGLATLATGVAFSIEADLGTSPIASVSYVISLFTPFTVGNLTIFIHSILIVLQILILRTRYKPFLLLQLPVAILFGYFTDLVICAIESISYSSYYQQWILCIIGIVFNSIGVFLLVKARIITLAAEGLVIAICEVFPIKFGNMKVLLDLSFVLVAGSLSLIFLNGIYGIGKGTIATAVFVGWITKGLDRILEKLKQKYIIKTSFE